MNTCNSYFINVSYNEKQYRIYTTWNDYNFVLTVIDNFNVFESNVTESTLKTLAEKYEVIFNIYLEQLRNSLCNKDVNNIIYERNDDKFTIFRKEGSILIQFADFTLEKSNFNSAIIKLLDTITESNEFYRNQVLTLQKEINISLKEKNSYLQKLEDFAIKKKDMEHELYSKFLLILNQKKQQIQSFQEVMKKYNVNENKLKQETISDTDSDTSSLNEPTEIITHNVQIENHEETSKKKRTSCTEEHSVGIKSLPKRVKCNENPGPSEVITEEKETTNDVENNSKENTIENDEDSQNLNFNTQDLFDRF